MSETDARASFRLLFQPAPEFAHMFDRVEWMINELLHMCSECGKCCNTETFHLTDVDTIVVARGLYEIGGRKMVSGHIVENLSPLNKWGRFVFTFSGMCPFRENGHCSLGRDRPLTCALFPMKLVAFLDHDTNRPRQPFLTVMRPEGKYPCDPVAEAVLDEVVALGSRDPMKAILTLEYLASSRVGIDNFAYLFGQPQGRGDERFNPPELADILTDGEIELLLMQRFMALYGLISPPVMGRSSQISDSIVDELLSDKNRELVDRRTAERLGRIRDRRSSLFEMKQIIDDGFSEAAPSSGR